MIESEYNINENICNKLGLYAEDTLYYIYGLFHSTDYKEKYANDLSKSLPRIPVVKNVNKYVEVGYQLAELHLNYETVEPYSDLQIEKNNNPS